MRFLHRSGSSHARDNNWSGRGAGHRLAAVVVTAGLAAGTMTILEIATSGSASAGVIGPASQVSEPGFAGMVTSSGRQLGTARLANGQRGVCLDAGGRAWPGGAASAQHVHHPRAAYVLATWGSTTDAVRAAAVAAVVSVDLGQNSNPAYLRSTIAQLHRAYPAQARRMEDLRRQMLSEATRYAGGYSASALQVVPGGTDARGGLGRVTGIGARSSQGHHVPGRRVTLTLTGATWSRNDKASITLTSTTEAQSLAWHHAQPGKVTVTERISGLPQTFYRRQPPVSGSQRVGMSAGTTSVTDRASATDVTRLRVHKIDGRTRHALRGARFRVWNDLDGDATQRAGEPTITATTGVAGNLPLFTAFAGSRVCLEELAAPAGYTLRTDVVCRTARKGGTTSVPVVVTLTNYTVPRYPLTVTKTTDASDPGNPAGIVGVTIEVRQGSASGPVVPGSRYTFTAADVVSGTGTHTYDAVFERNKTYVVVIVAEPRGYEPDQQVVRAQVTGGGGGPVELGAELLDYRIWSPQLSTQVSDQSADLGSRILDHVKVSDTGGHTVPGTWTLLGPLAPNSAGTCRGLDWSRASVAASGVFTATGDGTYTVGGHRVVRTGCYTYTESLQETEHTTPHAPTTPGIPSETTLVKGRPQLRTSVNRQRATAGATLVDEVSVTGTGGARLTGLWKILGPVAANARGTCSRLGWSGAPVLARGRFQVHGDGVYLVGRVVAARAGCYTYQEGVQASPTTHPAGWTTPGIVAETTVVLPTQPVVPDHPFVSTGFEGVLPGHGLDRSGPAGSVSTTGVRASLSPVEFHRGGLTPSKRGAGIWGSGADLRAVAGTTVIAGHVSDDHDSPLAFHGLNAAKVGQVVVTRSGGQVQRWRITSVRQVPRGALERSIFEQTMRRRLVLVTCSHRVVTSGGHFHYTHNRVVAAVPVR